MTIGAGVIWVAVAAITLFVLIRSRRHDERWGDGMIWAGGVALPVALLSVLLPYSFAVLADLRAPAGPDAVRVEITGHVWWWEVAYEAPDGGGKVVSANELRLPVGRPVELALRSADVIHSFWVPALGGKMDLIPGRTNTMVIEADEPGVYRGQCAEYCGTSHANMAFQAVAMHPENFDTWLAQEARPYRPPSPAPADADAGRADAEGLALFLKAGCGACHTIRGTDADGTIGPDLTHVGSRQTIAAGLLPNNAGTLAGWIADADGLKPGSRMPSYETLTGFELRTLGRFLHGLK